MWDIKSQLLFLFCGRNRLPYMCYWAVYCSVLNVWCDLAQLCPLNWTSVHAGWVIPKLCLGLCTCTLWHEVKLDCSESALHTCPLTSDPLELEISVLLHSCHMSHNFYLPNECAFKWQSHTQTGLEHSTVVLYQKWMKSCFTTSAVSGSVSLSKSRGLKRLLAQIIITQSQSFLLFLLFSLALGFWKCDV